MSDLPTSEERERRALRPYRLAVYSVYGFFVFAFIALLTRSVWLDLYGPGVEPVQAEALAPAGCVDSLEHLFLQLQARAGFSPLPGEQRDWDHFIRDFDDRLDALKAGCEGGAGEGATAEEVALQSAITEVSAQLDAWRQHMARCGRQEEEERAVLMESFARLRLASAASR